MPRVPRRRCRLPYFQYLTSPFARFLAQADSLRADQIHRVVSQSKSLQDGRGNEYVKHALQKDIKPSDSSEDKDFNGVVQVDFAFFDLKPNDFHGVKVLLQSFLDDKKWDLSGFVDLILEQTTVGTVVKVEDDDDSGLFSVITVLNLARYQAHECIMELKAFILKQCVEENIRCKLKSLLNEQAKDVGLLVSQRVVNLPPRLLPHLYRGLFDEVSWATEDEPTEDLRSSFRFKCYLIVSKVYKHRNANKKKPYAHCDEELVYIKPEDEIFHQLCSWSFFFPLHVQCVATQELRDYRLTGLVMAVAAEKVPIFRRRLPTFVANLES